LTLSNDDPVLRSARREALVVLAVWLVAMAYTVGYCYTFGYERQPASLSLVLGFPDWVFWGIVAPWTACTLVSAWFSFAFVRDDDLGAEEAEAQLGAVIGTGGGGETDDG
jgi:hypothetical protein